MESGAAGTPIAGTPASVATGSGVRKKKCGCRWKRTKSKLAPTGGPGPGRPRKESSPAPLMLEKKKQQQQVVWPTFEELCIALNSCDWDTHMAKEFENFKRLGLLQKATELYDITPVSTWLAQKRSTDENGARRLCKTVRAIQQWCAAAVHLQNYSTIPFSMAAASVATVARKDSTFAWETNLNLTSKATAFKLVRGCVEHFPATPFQESPHVMMYIFDQMYRVADVRAKGGHSTRMEKIQGDGRVQAGRNGVVGEGWERVVLINWMRLPIPVTLLDLTPEDVQVLRTDGPFVGSYDNVYPIISTRHVRVRKHLQPPYSPP